MEDTVTGGDGSKKHKVIRSIKALGNQDEVKALGNQDEGCP